jgi:hypothetical protein
LVALVVPPFENAAVTDRRTGIEESGWVGAANKFIAPATGLDSQETDAAGETFEIALQARHTIG